MTKSSAANRLSKKMRIIIKGDAYTLVSCIVDELNRAGKDASFSFAHPSDVTSNLHLQGETTLKDAIEAAKRVDVTLESFERHILNSFPNLSPPEESPRIDAGIAVHYEG